MHTMQTTRQELALIKGSDKYSWCTYKGKRVVLVSGFPHGYQFTRSSSR